MSNPKVGDPDVEPEAATQLLSVTVADTVSPAFNHAPTMPLPVVKATEETVGATAAPAVLALEY
jgi:hypothetical protein